MKPLERLSHGSLQRRITLTFALFVAAIMLAVTVAVGLRLAGTLSEGLKSDLQFQVENEARLIQQRLEYLLEASETLARNPLLVSGLNDPVAREGYLPKLVQNFSETRNVASLALVDFDGLPVFSTLQRAPTYNESSHLRSALTRAVTTVYVDPRTRHIVTMVPIEYYRTTLGALVIEFDLPDIANTILPHKPVFGHRLLVAGQTVYDHTPMPDADALRASHAVADQSERLSLRGTGLRIEVSAKKAEYLAPVRKAMVEIALLGLLASVAAVFLAARWGHSITRPILALCERVQTSDGSPGRRCAPVGTGDELETLARLFDERTAALKQVQEGLEERVRERTEELEHARMAAEDANKAKSVFLANMSHELRTPMNAILGFAQLMARDTGLSHANVEHIKAIHRSGEHLLALINDVLDISKIEAGRMVVEDSIFDLAEMLLTLEEMLHVRAEQKGLTFRREQDPDLPRYVHGDARKLRQILINLLSNAVKFTDAGHVEFRIGRDEAAHPGAVVFEVRDTGGGIEQSDLERIFEAFYQTPESAKRGEGTGLGLAISREYARLMGGGIEVESQRGQGSCFRAWVPLEAIDEDKVVEQERMQDVGGLAPGQPTYRILVAEDKDDNRHLLVEILTSVGFEVREAADGDEALKVFKAWRPHLIWMDMRMPIMDGYEATRRIKATPEGQGTVVIALTASAFEEDREQVLAAGCDDFLRKPLDTHKLFSLMHKHLGVKFTYNAAAREPADMTAHPTGPTRQDMARLPQALVAELERAANELDVKGVKAAIEGIRDLAPDCADGLQALAAAYRYDEIQNLCRHEPH